MVGGYLLPSLTGCCLRRLLVPKRASAPRYIAPLERRVTARVTGHRPGVSGRPVGTEDRAGGEQAVALSIFPARESRLTHL
jgi:hypothetical protein